MLTGCVAVVRHPRVGADQTSPGAGPIIVLETAKGVIEIETYPEEAPKTVAHIVALVKRGFYNGLRFHRAEPSFVIQIGDPQTRDMTKQAWWGTGSSGKPIGVAEITKKRGTSAAPSDGAQRLGERRRQPVLHHAARRRPTLDGKYAVFGRVIKGMDVAAKIQKADVLKKASVKG